MTVAAVIAIVFAAMGGIFVLLNLAVLGPILRGPRRPHPEKSRVYECGEVPVGTARVRFNPRFLLVAVIFVVFEVEAAFLFPWAAAFREAGPLALLDGILFVLILVAGYVWAWSAGELRWIIGEDE